MVPGEVVTYTNGKFAPAANTRSWTAIDKEYATLARRRAIGGYEAVSLEALARISARCDVALSSNPRLALTCSTIKTDVAYSQSGTAEMYSRAINGEPLIVHQTKSKK